jgi:hypothetical protein
MDSQIVINLLWFYCGFCIVKSFTEPIIELLLTHEHPMFEKLHVFVISIVLFVPTLIDEYVD